METNLHKQKIQILGRLIKESSLTLEEALLILQEDEKPPVIPTPQYYPSTGIGTWTTPSIGGYVQPTTVFGSSSAALAGITATNTTGLNQAMFKEEIINESMMTDKMSKALRDADI